MIKFCKRCQEEKCNCCPSGYYFGWKDSVRNCPNCGYEFRDIDFPRRLVANADWEYIKSRINKKHPELKL